MIEWQIKIEIGFIFLQARSDFEARKRLKELKEQRGDDKWMLPSLSKRVTEEPEVPITVDICLSHLPDIPWS